MSDIPRTDEVTAFKGGWDNNFFALKNLSRELEAELQEAREKLKEADHIITMLQDEYWNVRIRNQGDTGSELSKDIRRWKLESEASDE